MGTFVPSDLIEEITSRISIYEIVSKYVSLKRVGKNFVGLCPFHSEKTPSFTVNESKGLFYCFGCSEGGNVVNFLMKIENMEFTEAIEELAKNAGIDITGYKKSLSHEDIKNRKTVLNLLNKTADFYHRTLMSAKGTKAREYLKNRGIDEESIIKFNLGYAPPEGNSLLNYLLQLGIDEKTIHQASLITSVSHGKDFFRDRVIFPIYNSKGELVGFGGRGIGEDSSPKYLNSPESYIFQKRKILYGFNLAKPHIQKTGFVLIVEGYVDSITMHSYGFKNTVATLGTSLSDYHLRDLKKISKDIRMLYDGDESGIRAALRSLDIFLRNEITPQIIPLPSGEDPDEFLRSRGKEEMKKLIDKSSPLIQYYIDFQFQNSTESIENKKQAINNVAIIIQSVDNPVEREHYIKYASKKFSLSEETIKDIIKGNVQNHNRGSILWSSSTEEEDIIFKLALSDKDFLITLWERGLIEVLKVDKIKDLLKKFAGYISEHSEVTFHSLIKNLDPKDSKIVLSKSIIEFPEGVDVHVLKKEILLKLELKKKDLMIKKNLSIQEKQELFRQKVKIIEELRMLTTKNK